MTTLMMGPRQSPYGLIEELFWDRPWRLLVCCLLLNQTTRKQLDLVLVRFFERFPEPQVRTNAHTSTSTHTHLDTHTSCLTHTHTHTSCLTRTHTHTHTHTSNNHARVVPSPSWLARARRGAFSRLSGSSPLAACRWRTIPSPSLSLSLPRNFFPDSLPLSPSLSLSLSLPLPLSFSSSPSLFLSLSLLQHALPLTTCTLSLSDNMHSL